MMTLLKIPRFNSHRCLRLLHCHLSIYLFIYTWSSSFSPTTTTIITFCSITTLWLMMGRSVGNEWVKYAPPPLAAQIIFPEESHFNLSNMISAGLTSLFIVTTTTDDPYLATSLFSYLLLRITKLLLLLLKLLLIPTLEATEEDAARSGERVTACLTMSEGTHWLLRATISQLVGWLVGL